MPLGIHFLFLSKNASYLQVCFPIVLALPRNLKDREVYAGIGLRILKGTDLSFYILHFIIQVIWAPENSFFTCQMRKIYNRLWGFGLL